jgi:hypothetical protein
MLRYSFYSSVPSDCDELSKGRKHTSYTQSRESVPAVISGRREIDVTAHSQIFEYLRDAKLASQGRSVQLHETSSGGSTSSSEHQQGDA